MNKIYQNFIKLFKKNYKLIILLILASIILTYNLKDVALCGDEAIYSVVAKENLSQNSFLEMHYKDRLWFEKPPLMIWLTMASFKIFGIGEMEARIFPILFGILGVASIYFASKTFFKSEFAAFISGIILLSLNFYIWLSRQNMMDVAVFFFITLALTLYYKGLKENPKYLYYAGLATGLGVLTKSVVGLFPLIIFIIFLVVTKKIKFLINKSFIISVLISIAVFLPWHLFMIIKYKSYFWDAYFGHHVITRFSDGLHTAQADKINKLFFLIKFFEKISLLEIFFILSLAFLTKKNLKKNKEIFLLNFIWFAFVLIVFSFSKTKIMHYLLPIFAPFSLMIGWSLKNLFNRRKPLLIVPFVISFINLLPDFSNKKSFFGTGKILIAQILERIIKERFLIYFVFLIMLSSIFIFIFLYKKNPPITAKIAVFSILMLNLTIPLYPIRNQWIREVAESINKDSGQNIIKLNVENDYKYPTHSILFYLPARSVFWYINPDEKMIYDNCEKNKCKNFCFIENVTIDPSMPKTFTNKYGSYFPCKIVKRT